MTFVSFDDDLDWEFAFDSRLGHPTGTSEEPMAKRSNLYLFVLPYATKWGSGRRTD